MVVPTLLVAALTCFVLQTEVLSFGQVGGGRRVANSLKMQFSLSNYVSTNLLPPSSARPLVETEIFEREVEFDENRCYLLLVDYNVRTVGDIDQLHTLERLRFLGRLLDKMKSSKQVYFISSPK